MPSLLSDPQLQQELQALRQQVRQLQRAMVRSHITLTVSRRTPFLGQGVDITGTLTDAHGQPQPNAPAILSTTWGRLRSRDRLAPEQGTSLTVRTGADGRFRVELLPPTSEDLLAVQQQALETFLARLDATAATPRQTEAQLQEMARLYQWDANFAYRQALDIYFRDFGQGLLESVNTQDYLQRWTFLDATVVAYAQSDETAGEPRSAVQSSAALLVSYKNWLGPWLEAFLTLSQAQSPLETTLGTVTQNGSAGPLVDGVYQQIADYVGNQSGIVGAYIGRKVAERTVQSFLLEDRLANLDERARASLVPSLQVATTTLESGGSSGLKNLVQTRSQLQREVGGRIAASEIAVENLTGQLGQVTTQISGLQDTVTSFDGQVGTITRQLGTVQSDLRTVTGQVDTLQGRQTQFDNRLSRVSADLAGFNTRVDSLQSRFDPVDQRLGSVTTEFSNLQTRFDGLETSSRNRLAQFDSRLTDSADTLDRLDTRLGSVTTRVDTLDSNLATLDRNLSDFNGGLDQLGSRLDDFNQDVEQLQTGNQRLTEQVTTLQTRTADLGNRLDGVGGELGQIRDRFDGVAQNVATLQDSNRQLEDQVGSLQTTTRELDGQVASLDQEVVGLKQDNRTLNQRITRVDRRVDGVRVDVNTLDTQVTTLDGQVTDVQGRFTTLDNQVSTLDSQYSSLNRSLNRTNTRIGNLQTRVDGFDTQLSTVSNQVSQLDTNVTRLDGRFSTLNTQIGGLQRNLGTLNRLSSTRMLRLEDSISRVGNNVLSLRTDISQ